MNRTQSAEPGLEARWAAPNPLVFARFYFLLTSVLAAASLPGLFAAGSASGQAIASYSLRWAGLLAICFALGLGLLAVFVLLYTRTAPRLTASAQTGLSALARLGRWNLLLAGLTWAGYIGLVFWRFERQLDGPLPRLWLFWLAGGLAAFFFCAAWPKLSFYWSLIAASIALGFMVRVLGFLPEISASPFTLAWSEASRFYYASLPYARQLYGMPAALSPWHPSRYLVLGLPFLVPGLPLWFFRLWQVLLWLGLSLGTGLALMHRFRLGSRRAVLVGAAWTALFLLQGPVYYHLLVCVILVLWGFDSRRFWVSTAIVLAASLWAGISRVNWYPVPAMLAAALYVLENPLAGPRGWLRYLLLPAVWGAAGVATAAAAHAAYVALSGQTDPSIFDSTFSSALLWYRLLPNPTSEMGVLPVILLVSLPALALIGGSWLLGFKTWHPLRQLALAGMCAVLFGGGMVVSTKIGGGSNIHNVDAFLVLLLVLAAAVWMGVYTPENRAAPRPWRPWLLTFLIAAVPLAWSINIPSPFSAPNSAQDAADLASLNAFLKTNAAGGEVLFITQRQLVTFGLADGQRLVPDYEVLTLSEMALAQNSAYLARFEQDLRSHRFAAIVVDPQREVLQDPAQFGFAEENNAWVTFISKPILATYKTALRIERSSGPSVDIMVPLP